jgi:hypothetical protein
MLGPKGDVRVAADHGPGDCALTNLNAASPATSLRSAPVLARKRPVVHQTPVSERWWLLEAGPSLAMGKAAYREANLGGERRSHAGGTAF